MAKDTPTEAEQAAAAAVLKTEDPPPAEEAPPEPSPTEVPAPPAQNSISGEASVPGPPDPGPVDPEEAKAAAEDEAKTIAEMAASNKPDPAPEPDPEPKEDVPTTFVVYKAIDGAAYPGLFLTVVIQIDEDEDGNPVLETITLEERVPTEVPEFHADALTQLDSAHYTIESA